jgi:predicted alpha/beta hydrolase family esterase
MPNEADPSLAAWKTALEGELAELENGAILVGHSIGGSILIDVLTDSPPRVEVGGVFLIAAPFIGDGGWKSEEMTPRRRLADDLPESVPFFLYHGEDDDTVPVAHVELYARAIPGARVRRLKSRDHQLNNDLSDVAHDILDLITSPDTWSNLA